MIPPTRFLSRVVLTAVCLLPGSSLQAADDAARIEFFEKKVRPLLVNNCYNCHSASTNARGGLRVDDRNGLLQGGSSGPAVVPGQPDKSLLIQAVRYAGDVSKMPPKKQLAAEEIAVLVRWVQDGAAWPREAVPVVTGKPSPKFEQLRKEHWAWQPLRDVQVPEVQDAAWTRSDIDRFILAGLEAKELKPVRDAERATLLRRVTFDLTGLPPTPAQLDDFIHDPSADAFEKVVDRLLASPAFGERWGRHWLDVARYGESTGSGRNVPYPHAWRYRDYVIDSFNSDKPYDRFIREQIAGDLLSADTPEQRDELLVATGFLALGVKDVNQRFKVRFIMDNIDEQIDTVTRSVLALTASCARCHDHKFDPIPTTDYYALAGIFHSTDLCAGVRNKMGGSGLDYYDTTMLLEVGKGQPVDPRTVAKVEEVKLELQKCQAEFEAIRGQPAGMAKGPNGQPKATIVRQEMTRLQNQLLSLTDVAAQGRAALGVRDGKQIGDTQIRIRGEAERLGPSVPRGFLSLIDVPGAAPVNPQQSGRLELAHWLTSDKNPLTPRVLANRVWHHLFGSGLVRTVDNFGVTGDTPSHPELLDHLARQLVRDGWSIKRLVRSVVVSRAYQLSGDSEAALHLADPANRLVWRHSPRRLDAEEIRDAMLASGGNLCLSPPEASPASAMKVMELRNNSADAQRLEEAAQTSLHRSLYLPLLRGLTPRALEVFDFAQQGMVTGDRDTTTVATQALYLLNDAFVRQHARTLADRLLPRTALDDVGRIHLAYRLTVGRAATAAEAERARRYLVDYEAAVKRSPPARDASGQPLQPRTEAWSSLCQALLASAEFRYVR
ncbi:MAG: PSD1 domain-containing protein [Planctomycetia bacterium]|nr:PSD1 domain-containing protein [Planctomycetia bacterium]